MPAAAPSRTDPLQWLHAVIEDDANRLCIETTAGDRYTYGDMVTLANRMAAALAARGIRAGDRVATQVDKSPQAIALYLACLRLGAILVPLNTAYTLVELEYFIGDADPSMVVVHPHSVAPLRSILTNDKLCIESMDAYGRSSLLLDARLADSRYEAFAGDPSALAALLYTSGTTGRSKGAMLTRGNLASNAATLVDAWRFNSADVLLHALPIFHVHGLFVAINTVLAAGASMLLVERFDAGQVVDLLPRVTVMMGVPTFYTRLLQQPRLTPNSTRNIRLFISGSAPLLADTHREFQARTGHAILERYGMSETLMNTSNPYAGPRVPGSVGPALPDIDIRITDPQSGAPAPGPNAIGMIEVRGPNVFHGYWRMPDKTAMEFRSDGFFVTGDLGKVDERGYVYIVGRNKDLIISGGFNVYPIEVELEIDALPGVIESAVIGIPHPDFGEGVTAAVVAASGSELTEAAVRLALEQRLAKFKVPKRILFVDELPRNTMGKVQKSELRERFRNLYGSS